MTGSTASLDTTRPKLTRSVAISTAWREARAAVISVADEWKAASDAEREDLAQRISGRLLVEVWRSRVGSRVPWEPHWRNLPSPSLAASLGRPVERAAAALAPASVVELGFLLGSLYTSLLPAELRAQLGAYYTPPLLAERLLDLVAAEGCDWANHQVLDPACGGGAFLVPVANRIIADYRIRCLDAEERLGVLRAAIHGIEIDPFAAWMTGSILELLLIDDTRKVGRPLAASIVTGDALQSPEEIRDAFDLVVGNPPYGRVRLSASRRAAFSRSLHGHANLYGLFLDAALRWRKPGGLIGFVTPTSFLGGQYFQRLRSLLLEQAPPLVIDIVEERTGVFREVQQETCLAVFGTASTAIPTIHHLRAREETLSVERAGSFPLSGQERVPWILPRTSRQARLVQTVDRLPNRLHTLGYRASTGPLVWNRHKRDLRERADESTYPLIWAEAVRPNFLDLRYRQRAHVPYVRVSDERGHLCDRGPCVLVQRTTAKEQHRRLIACAVPAEFFARWGAMVVENHVNVLRPSGSARVTPRALAAVLNTCLIDELFRCLSGSVAVSATELHALPLPALEVFDRVEEALCSSEDAEQIDLLVEELVGASG